MAQLDFYLSIEERNIFFQYCMERGCVLIPGIHYPQKEYAILKSSKGLMEYKNCTQFFILNDAYTTHPLEMGTFKKNDTDLFFVRQRYGGFAIDFVSPALAEINNNRIGPGSISIYPFYYIKNEKSYSTEELKAFYTTLVKFIKKMCVKVSAINRTYWLGNETIELAKQKKLTLVNLLDINRNEVDMLELAVLSQK
ncbi:MAG: hypothetical protein K0Q79_1653 [Flavipsychrobacter sp.]|jgi:hypothetical protein|nr:hypothetical protein [Flavipsychrobacter sp.]